MDLNTYFWLIPVIIIISYPIIFAMGWLSARIDMKTVLKQAKFIPDKYYKALDALVEKKSDITVQILDEIINLEDTNQEYNNLFDTTLTLGKLYRLRGENDKAIILHQSLLKSNQLDYDKTIKINYELGLDYINTGLIDRAEKQFTKLIKSYKSNNAKEILLNIYQQDRNWTNAIELAKELNMDGQSYNIEIAQFYCELAQQYFFKSDYDEAKNMAIKAIENNQKCTRANMILGEIETALFNYKDAIKYYEAIEQQNYIYLSMIQEKLFCAYDKFGQKEIGINRIIGYSKMFSLIDLIDFIYDKAKIILGEVEAKNITIDLIRKNPNIASIYKLLMINMQNIHSLSQGDYELILNTIRKQIDKYFMYKCKQCNFKSQIFFWHCPACNVWESYLPYKVEV